MKVSVTILLALSGLALLPAQDVNEQARQLTMRGEGREARALLAKASEQDALTGGLAYAEFLDRHGDLAARTAYERALQRVSDPRQRQEILQRLVTLNLMAGDDSAASRSHEAYRQAGGTRLTLPRSTAKPTTARTTIAVPGPLRSFARMAALSPDLAPDDVVPALARNIVTNGYQAGNGNEGLEQTEYLKLVFRYLGQARELEKLANAEKKLRVDQCESTQTGELLRVLGYRMRGGCGAEVVLETVNATRAFLTIDSGFPLADLEQALRTNRPFELDYRPTQVPILYEPAWWLTSKEQGPEFLDAFLNDPALCRLYLGLSKLDHNTAEALRQAMPLPRLKAHAHILDFYGGLFEIRDGKAVVPGGPVVAKAWGDVLAANPDQGAQFFEKLLIRDDGWMASYYDCVGRVSQPVRLFLTEPTRMRRIYAAIKGKITSPGPARPVFRANTDLMLLTTRLRLEPNGQAHIPGTLEIWKNLFIKHPHGKYDGKLTKAASGWKEPDDLIEALFALCRKVVENEPLKIYMALSDMNRHRARPLEPATVDRLARAYRDYGAQYSILSESPQLTDATILRFMDSAEAIGEIGNQALRSDAAGIFQSLVGLWQIFTRHQAIAPAETDAALNALLAAFPAKGASERVLFDAGRQGVRALLAATRSPEKVVAQDRMIDLLAGAVRTDDDTHRTVIEDLIRLFEAQRLVSLTTLFELSDHLEAVAAGGKPDATLIRRLTARISEVPLPRSSLSTAEKNALAFGYWTDRHIDAERKVNLRAAIEKAQGAPEKLREIRGELTPFLRDTLVGLNYIHYAPPGGQVMRTNPLFVRSHDFLGSQGSVATWRHTDVLGSGWPSSAGGRLVGSLASLPYALAEAEQNFLIPTREQALIWGDLVPQMILGAKVPRWWNVTPAQMHYAALHLRLGETLLAEAAVDAARREAILAAYGQLASPARTALVSERLQAGDVKGALEQVLPSETFILAARMVQEKPDALTGSERRLAAEITRLTRDHPEQVSRAAISRAFGVPHPTLANSYQPELLGLRTFPTLMGFSSRIMAESWESSVLYYAALADELHLEPAQLNIMVPQWTQATVEKIFATHLEDWPALLRSLRLVGEEVRAGNQRQGAAGAGGGE